MKRIYFILFLSFCPIIAYAKYCPACLQTYQAQTVRGQSKLIYHWLYRTLKSKKIIERTDLRHLFNKNLKVNINGGRIATGRRAFYNFLNSTRKKQSLLESHLEKVIVDQNSAVMKYQFIVQRKNGKKYRTLAIAILDFKHHKLTNWWEVSYTHPIS